MAVLEKKEEKVSLIITIVVHVALILLFMYVGLKHIEPIPEQGIVVDFGYDNTGMNIQENEPQPQSQNTQPPVSPETEENILTQDEPESIELPKEKNKPDKKVDKKNEKTEEEKVKEELKNLLNTWQKNQNTGKPADEGNTGRPGNQGEQDGDPNSGQFSGGGNGSNISYSLNGRTVKSYPSIDDDSQEQGIVVVEIWVDRDGRVVRAKPGYRGSTTTSQVLYKKATEAALKTRFSVKADAPEEQRGTITFRFILN